MKLLATILLAMLIEIGASAQIVDQRFPVIIERNVEVKMRDGIILRADIYRPNADGKFPVLVHRQAYGKTYPGVYFDFQFNAAALGYVVIVQDLRGRSNSEGEWYPFKYEGQDGYDTVEWAARLPYSNGKVGMWGASYNGAPVLLGAIASPPHLKGIFTFVTPSNYHDGWIYQGGVFCPWAGGNWGLGMAQPSSGSSGSRGELFWKLPQPNVATLEPPKTDGLPTYFLDWLRHEGYDDYWKQWSVEEHCSKISVPAYHVGGWYDEFLAGALRSYSCIKTKGATEAARRGQRLMVVVGNHAGSGRIQIGNSTTRKVGDVDFGPNAVIDQNAVMLRWFDHLLKGIPNGIETEKPVKIFVMGENTWREEDDWPLPHAKRTRYYLYSDGKANSLQGDGTLSLEPPLAQPADSLVSDPANPVPTHGGPTGSMQLAPGPFDQRPVEVRGDVLVYTTSAFANDYEVTGPVRLELYASSSAVDTDFTGKLVDVWPDGYAQNLTDGIIRAQYRNSAEKPEFMNPGEIYKFTVDLWATSNVFRKGHKLRLEVSSSNFPRFNRNLNAGDPMLYATRVVKATNTIYHDRSHPSSLILSVVPK